MTGETSAGPQDWMSQGACRTADPELFFPISLAGPAAHQVSMAKAVCRRCDVQARCRSYAVSTGQDGVWGATTREERMARPLPMAPPAATPRHDTPAGLASADPCHGPEARAGPRPGRGTA
jgi:WhiB family transcriptional regulator, redox-sensing transcriptional regulator